MVIYIYGVPWRIFILCGLSIFYFYFSPRWEHSHRGENIPTSVEILLTAVGMFPPRWEHSHRGEKYRGEKYFHRGGKSRDLWRHFRAPPSRADMRHHSSHYWNSMEHRHVHSTIVCVPTINYNNVWVPTTKYHSLWAPTIKYTRVWQPTVKYTRVWAPTNKVWVPTTKYHSLWAPTIKYN